MRPEQDTRQNRNATRQQTQTSNVGLFRHHVGLGLTFVDIESYNLSYEVAGGLQQRNMKANSRDHSFDLMKVKSYTTTFSRVIAVIRTLQPRMLTFKTQSPNRLDRVFFLVNGNAN